MARHIDAGILGVVTVCAESECGSLERRLGRARWAWWRKCGLVGLEFEDQIGTCCSEWPSATKSDSCHGRIRIEVLASTKRKIRKYSAVLGKRRDDVT